MISKELLSKVLREEVNNDIRIENSIINFSYKYIGYAEINIYELAYKCKEWAYKNFKYTIIEYAGGVEVIDADENMVFQINNLEHPLVIFSQKFIFKACQWILDNKDNQWHKQN